MPIKSLFRPLQIVLAALALGQSASIQAQAFPVSLDDVLPQTSAPLHVHMQTDGGALVAIGSSSQLSVHRLDRNPSTSTYVSRRQFSSPRIMRSFEQDDAESFWVLRNSSANVFPPVPGTTLATLQLRINAQGELVEQALAALPLDARIVKVDQSHYAISGSQIINLASRSSANYVPCADAKGAPIASCLIWAMTAAHQGFWIVRSLPVAPGMTRLEALRFSALGELLQTQPLIAGYPRYFERQGEILRLAIVTGSVVTVLNVSDAAGWQIVQAGQFPGTSADQLVPVGTGEWLHSDATTISYYTPVPSQGMPQPLVARFSKTCPNCYLVRSNAGGEILVGHQPSNASPNRNFQWYDRDGNLKLERSGVYDAQFAVDGSALIISPDSANNPEYLVASWFNPLAQATVLEPLAPALLTPQLTELFVGRSNAILAYNYFPESAHSGLYTISAAGQRARVASTANGYLLRSAQSDAGSGIIHRKRIDRVTYSEFYESVDSATGTTFLAAATSQCGQPGSLVFIGVGADIYDLGRCETGAQIRKFSAGSATPIGQIPNAGGSFSLTRTRPELAGGDEFRVLQQQAQGSGALFTVYGVRDDVIGFRYQHTAFVDFPIPQLLSDGSLVVIAGELNALHSVRVSEHRLLENYPLCGDVLLDDDHGNVWSKISGVGPACRTTAFGEISRSPNSLAGTWRYNVASNGDPLLASHFGCARLHADGAYVRSGRFGAGQFLCQPTGLAGLVLDDVLYETRRNSNTSNIEPGKALIKAPLISVAEVVDSFGYDGFE